MLIKRSKKGVYALLGLTLMLLIACSAGQNRAPDAPADPQSSGPTERQASPTPFDTFPVPVGYTVTALPYSFKQPTQFVVSSSGDRLWVAEINGGENAENGRVITFDLQSGESEILLEKLDKPTGLAILNGEIWVATRDEILRATLPDSVTSLPLVPKVVVTNIPNNGRSNGTLTVSPSGQILYESSGNRSIPSSGRVFAHDPISGERRTLAKGLKGGYAHLFDPDGNLWLTEIADGRIGGEVLPGEINFVPVGRLDFSLNLDDEETIDFGWPTCFGRELSGPDCEGSEPAVTILPLSSTPTGIAHSPFEENLLLVPLWVPGEVVQISYELDGDGRPTGEPRPFIRGMSNPQHIVSQADADGRPAVWLSDYAAGEIYKIQQVE